jgi:hypothetical protein
MKNIIKSLLVSLVVIVGMLIAVPVQADPPGMPGAHGDTGDQPPGGGAPIASGLAILIGMGGAYAGKKVLEIK